MISFTRLKLHLTGTCLVVLTAASLAFAQDYRGIVQGVITDESRAAVAGAKVVLKNTGTNVESTKQADTSGHYQFDFVQPGVYSVSIQAPGFQSYLEEKVSVLTSGDVTVNATLKVGGVAETVTVTSEATQVQFNTSTMEATIQGQLLKDTPVLARNPFTLALLDPAVVNRYWDVGHRNPFYMWSSGGLDIGGSTGGKNDLELDGVSLNISARGSYNLPMDAVQEVSVQQNATDAEYGFSAGGTMTLSHKTGTNDIHGTGYYFGRNPALNAMTNRITREESVIRNHIWGGTIGQPILKSKLFNFFSYEQWKTTQPSSNISTVPTDAERNGDFSQALTPDGNLRQIFDPLTTVFDPATSTASRTLFPNNVIPASRFDPAGAKAVNDLWKPNRAGDDLSGVNNFKTTYAWWIKYWNISDRVDYNISDKWRLYSRFSKYQTRLDNPNWGGTIAVRSDNGGLMDALNGAIDLLYIASPRTTIDLRFGSTYVEDDYDSQWAKVDESVWNSFWPNGWYKPVLLALPGIYYPNFNFSGNGSASSGLSGWWIVHGRSHNPTVNITHEAGIHHMKAGWQMRYSYDQDGAPGPGGFTFNSIDTGSSFLGYNASTSGDMYASALLGVVNTGNANIQPLLDMHQQQWAYYFQDDIKLNRKITLNLGLRWEYETAPAEETRMLNRDLNLNQALPALADNPPSMPAEVTAISTIPYKWNGALVFTSDANPRMYNAPKNTFLPRVGIAVRLSDKMSFRAGYARYAVPMVTVHPETGGLPTYGFSQSTAALDPLEGSPRTFISNPFPAGSNALQLPAGSALGAYTEVGNSVSWWNQSLKVPMNDRFNVSLQRQMPWNLFTEATFFTNFSHNSQDPSMWGGNYSYNLNMVDPRLIYQYKGATDQAVSNPFYGLLPPDKMPGTLATEQTVPVSQLLRPYPQYGDLNLNAWPGSSDHYYALQLKAERRMGNGIGFLLAYNYNREYHDQYFNAIDQYDNKFTMLDRAYPRHSLRVSGTWDLPFGKGRQFANNINPILEGVIGGWTTSSMLMWSSGNLLTFQQADVTGDPRANVPAGDAFNPAVFQVPAAYTPRTNPWYYDGLRGPRFWQLDSTLVKYFPITERISLELRMEFYNLPNTFIKSDPDTGIGSGTMGQSTGVAAGNYGREIQYAARIHF